MTRASSVVNCQSTVTRSALRAATHAATSAASVARSVMRRSRHYRPSTLSSSSATLSQLPCLGVKWTSSRSHNRLASAGGKAR